MADVPVRKTESLWEQLQRIEDRILGRAHEIFRANGETPGKDLDNWLQAERELLWKPPIELLEKDNQFELKVAVAGMEPKDIKIEVTPEELLVRGETITEKKEDKGEIHTSEFQSGSLFRSVRFPKKVNPEKVKAEIRNGMLTITAPIAEEAKGRRVEIDAA